MYVVFDPSQTGLAEGVDVVVLGNGGPRVGFREVATVKELCRAFGGWCTAPGGGAHSQVMGTGRPVRMVDGPMKPDGLQRRILGRVVGYLGDTWGQPVRDLWMDDDEQLLKDKPFTLADLPQNYICECEGVCLEPLLKHGDKLQFSAIEPVNPGDVVCLWLKPIHTYETIPFQCMVKRLLTPLPIGPFPLPDYMPAPPVALVAMDNPAKTLAVPLDRVMAVHKCLGVYGGPKWKPAREAAQALAAQQQKAAAGGVT
jgi:hypothetical protein